MGRGSMLAVCGLQRTRLFIGAAIGWVGMLSACLELVWGGLSVLAVVWGITVLFGASILYCGGSLVICGVVVCCGGLFLGAGVLGLVRTSRILFVGVLA